MPREATAARPTASSAPPLHFDVIIVGAGISGIDAAYRIQEQNPKLSYTILEGRHATGGTWDLFRYPGIRSDSDMATLGFPFHAWRGQKVILDGASIRGYVADTAREYGIDHRMRFGQKVVAASWSSSESRWTVTCETAIGTTTYTGGFLYACTGYYDYENGHAPQWPGMDDFEGRIVYPQFWPDDLDYAGKQVVVVGSGATAVTLVPAMAQSAAHVTMLQRSPTYIVSLPSRDAIGEWLRARLPARVADEFVRWKNILYSMFTYTLARKRPDKVRELIRAGVLQALGSAYNSALHDVDIHFNPAYKPWDQRLCLVPDGDLFTALASGVASVQTGRIAAFLPKALLLESGQELPADVVVSATGLTMQLFGGVTVTVDGERADLSKRLVYKGTLMEGVPNFAFSFGYTNASWTLKVDLNARYVSKLLRFMKKKRRVAVTPVTTDKDIVREPLLGLSSGYIQRAASILPQQGPMPWRVFQNYILDLIAYRTARFDDGTLRFVKKGKA